MLISPRQSVLFVLLFSIFHTYFLSSQEYRNQIDQSTLVEVELETFSGKRGQTVTAEVIDGFLIYEGDIIVGRVKNGQKSAGNAVFGNSWPNGTIPYEIEPGLPDQDRITDAVAHLNANTNLCIVPRTGQADYITFRTSTGCSSSIGRIGGQQFINLAGGCTTGNTIHELLHAAGFFHTQSRHDRDEYVIINFENITPGAIGNFFKYRRGTDIGMYDYGSIMHYGETFFSNNGMQTIEVRIPPGTGNTVIGQRNGVASSDIAGVSQIYTTASTCVSTIPDINLTYQVNSSGVSGNVISANVTISNNGTLPSGPFEVGFYFYDNDSGISYLFDSDAFTSGLAAGGSQVLNKSLNINSLDAPNIQDAWFLISIDHIFQVTESDESQSDNRYWLSLGAISPCPFRNDLFYYELENTFEASGEISTSILGSHYVGSAATLDAPEIFITDRFTVPQGMVLNLQSNGCTN